MDTHERPIEPRDAQPLADGPAAGGAPGHDVPHASGDTADASPPGTDSAADVPDERGALRADFERYLRIARACHGGLRARVAAATEFGFLAIAVYRFGRWSRRVRPWILSLPFKILYRVLDLLVQVLFGISLSTQYAIGRGFYIGHYGGIFVHGQLGQNCSIGQGVTIGGKGAGRTTGYPVIGNDVYLGAGSMVIGHIRIGDGVVVGANTVVVQDVPDRHRVVSAPARILPPRG